ncbi:ankyrin repeat-containing domain protein [Xylaria nigripes]|nr:ankyrin repeat-containing domain protein [Xylaria nigripes]
MKRGLLVLSWTGFPSTVKCSVFRDSIVVCVQADPTKRPTHLIGKFCDEYTQVSEVADAIPCAITLAGLYSGAIEPPIIQPWKVVEKIQWLLKASFDSPKIPEEVLLFRLKGFFEMSDEESAVLNFSQLRRLVIRRHAYVELVDSDAFDLQNVGASPINQSIYDSTFEVFIEETHKLMVNVIFHGSLDIVRYLVTSNAVRPNDEWDGMSHLLNTTTFSRSLMNKLSGLYWASRRDNSELVATLCKHLKARGQLGQVIESRPSERSMEGQTAAYTAATSGWWKNLNILRQSGADPNCIVGDEPRLIDLAVRSRCFGVSISPNCEDNVPTVYYLLLHGAMVSDTTLKNVVENTENETADILPVLYEDGAECRNGWETIGKLWVRDTNPSTYMIEVQNPD